MTLYAMGLGHDKTLARFVDVSRRAGAEVELIDLSGAAHGGWRLDVPARAGSRVVLADQEVALDDRASIYARLVDLSPVLAEPESGQWRAMLAGFTAFLQSAPGRIVNRPGAHAHNSAKPLHEAWLARRGFNVAPALTTSDPARIGAFLGRHGRAVVKSLCGMRGTAVIATARDFEDFSSAQGPVHLQCVIEGHDVRAHTIGDAVIAERIEADVLDYRSAEANARHEAADVPADLAARMVEASREMGLAFAGWDFKVDSAGVYWCLEVNPMPGYDPYDRRADGAISRALLAYLAQGAC